MPVVTNTQLQPRDIQLLRGLFESRIMSLAHITAIYFAGKPQAAKKRIQLLKRAGYLGERPRRPYEPSLLFMTRKAFEHLDTTGALNDYPALGRSSFARRVRVSPMTMRHEVDVMNVKASLIAAMQKKPELAVVEFATWPLLFSFKARRPPKPGTGGNGPWAWLRPDGFVRLRQQLPDGGESEHLFYLEVDRSSETQDNLRRRAYAYLDHYRTGGLADRFGRPRSEYKEFPFRVLMVFPNAERRNNAADCLLRGNPPILTLTWLTTMEELLSDPLGPIWVQPFDYREVVKGTQFDTTQPLAGVYRRQPEREAFIERSIGRHSLLQ